MRNIDISKLTQADLADQAAMMEAFRNYLRRTLRYTESEVEIAAKDMENPFFTPYIMMDTKGRCRIDGSEYVACFCYTDYTLCGLDHLKGKKPFEFYTLFDQTPHPDGKVDLVMDARRMYVL